MNQKYLISIYCIRMLRKDDGMDYHIVRMDETLDQIAKTYNISEESIINANKEMNPEHLFIGKVLIIPLD